MTDTLMVAGSGSGLLVNESGFLAVGQNCCECHCQACAECFPSCLDAANVGVWQYDYAIAFSWGTLSGTVTSNATDATSAFITTSGNCNQHESGFYCPCCENFPTIAGGQLCVYGAGPDPDNLCPPDYHPEGASHLSFTSGFTIRKNITLEAVQAHCLANSELRTVDVIADENCDFGIEPYQEEILFPYDVIDWDAFTLTDGALFQIGATAWCAIMEDGVLLALNDAYIRTILFGSGHSENHISGCSFGPATLSGAPYTLPIPLKCQYDWGSDPVEHLSTTDSCSKVS